MHNFIKNYLIKRGWIPPLPKLEVYCRRCKGWHPVGYGTDTKTGRETNMIMAATCGDVSYLVGVAGQIIDGHRTRPSKIENQKS